MVIVGMEMGISRLRKRCRPRAKALRCDRVLSLEHGKPMVFGKNRDKGIRMNGALPEVVTIGENGITENDLLVHDIHLKDPSVAFMLGRMEQPDFPQPVGIFRAIERPTYEDMMVDQIEASVAKAGPGNLEKLINSGDTWTAVSYTHLTLPTSD